MNHLSSMREEQVMNEHDEQTVRDDEVLRLSQMIERLGQIEVHATIVATRDGERKAWELLRPWSLDPDRTVEEWEELVLWVDTMIFAHGVTAIPPCWPAHPNLVNQLEALRCAWEVAVANHPGPELIAWYTSSWRPFLVYAQSLDWCRNGHQLDPKTPVTDTRFLVGRRRRENPDTTNM